MIGDQRPFVAALLSLDPEMLPVWLSNKGELSDLSLAQAAKNPVVLAELQKKVDEVNKSVSNAEAIKKFAVIESELTEESGHLTPSMKIKGKLLPEISHPLLMKSTEGLQLPPKLSTWVTNPS